MRHICTSIVATLVLTEMPFANSNTVLANSTSILPNAIEASPENIMIVIANLKTTLQLTVCSPY
jgi:hypothetical protein